MTSMVHRASATGGLHALAHRDARASKGGLRRSRSQMKGEVASWRHVEQSDYELPSHFLANSGGFSS